MCRGKDPMIRQAEYKENNQFRKLWDICFSDSENFRNWFVVVRKGRQFVCTAVSHTQRFKSGGQGTGRRKHGCLQMTMGAAHGSQGISGTWDRM